MLALLVLISPVLSLLEIPLKAIPSSLSSTSKLSFYYNDIMPITNFDNTHYIAQIYIGSPPQPFNLLVDTSSRWVWVPDSTCFHCPQTHKFQNWESSTFRYGWSRVAVNDTYSISGYVNTDTVAIANLSMNATGQSFVAVDTQEQFNTTYADGVLGLGFADSSYKTLIQTLNEQFYIDHAMFSIYLNDKDNETGIESALMLGGYDTCSFAQCEEDIAWIPLKGNSTWQVNLYKVKYAGEKIDSETRARFITTEKDIRAPKHSFEKLYQKTNSQLSGNCIYKEDYIRCSCNQSEDFGSMEFYIEGYIFDISGKHLFRKMDDEECFIRVAAWDRNYWGIGTNFMRKYYTIYSIDTLEIGIPGYSGKYKTDDSGEGESMSVGEIVGICFGTVFGVCFVIGGILIYRACKNKRRTGDHYNPGWIALSILSS
jgi:saccharopepsin